MVLDATVERVNQVERVEGADIDAIEDIAPRL